MIANRGHKLCVTAIRSPDPNHPFLVSLREPHKPVSLTIQLILPLFER